MFIYKITNKTNGKIYIGQTEQEPQNRWKGHIYAANKDSPDMNITRAIKKYGLDSFSFEVVDEVDTQVDADIVEKQLIKEHRAAETAFGYNSTLGGKDCCPAWTTEHGRNKEKAIRDERLLLEQVVLDEVSAGIYPDDEYNEWEIGYSSEQVSVPIAQPKFVEKPWWISRTTLMQREREDYGNGEGFFESFDT
jgi:group I intron endonuclease